MIKRAAKNFCFCPLFSGSSGNAAYIGFGDDGLLIDCGKSGRTIETSLEAIGVEMRSIRGIFLTHAHADHVCGAGVLARRYKIPIFATRGTWSDIIERGGLGRIDETRVSLFDSAQKTVDTRLGELDGCGALEGITIETFPLPHDAREPVGYRFTCGSHRAVIATDIGYVTPELKAAAHGAEVILLESNHDLDMLKNGSYPWVLKRRILSNHGHLSNDAAGIFAAELVQNGTRRIYLGHLSHENNRPMLAFSTVAERLAAERIDPRKDVELIVAERDAPSPSFEC